MFGRFFRTVNYSSVNEDWRTECAALRLEPDGRVLCVTGSGDRPLDMLAVEATEVVAIDLNKAQNALLYLKAAAIAHLEYDAYTRFIGLRAGEGRWREEVLEGLSEHMPARVGAFWQSHKRAVRRGVLYCGRFERHMRRLSRLGRLLRPRTYRALLNFDDIEAQRRFVTESWDRAGWRLLFRLVLSRGVSRLFLGDPAYYAHTAVPVGATLYDRMKAALEHDLVRHNFMLSLVLRGRLSEDDLPPYLTASGCELIRSRLHLLSVTDADVVEYLESATGTFTRFSLSDVPSYLAEPDFRRLLAGVIRCSAPRARVVIRQFLTRYELPVDIATEFRREPDLEKRLAVEDRSFGYEFMIGEIRHAAG